MELLAPAGNVQKLFYAFTFGADAAYIGIKNFSLRMKADNFSGDDYEAVHALKAQFPDKKIYCALNSIFHDAELAAFRREIDYFRRYPIDAFIVQDMGVVPILQKAFPAAALHLSTQASCVNSEAVKLYRQLGFTRIVLGREISLDEITAIKDAVPDMELEAFAHGAMCIAYAGRCLMSAYLTGRSAQEGECAHTCRWNFSVKGNPKALAESGALVLEEAARAGEFFPLYETDGATALLSSKDLCMIDHLADMQASGVDAIKIEGRMKSIYYVALVTQAYRKALDAVSGTISFAEAAPFVAELDNVAHRESTTGFYYGRAAANTPTSGASDSPYLLAGTVDRRLSAAALEAVVRLGEKTMAARAAAFRMLSPEAQISRRAIMAAHPEKTPRPVTARDGWELFEYTPLNKICITQDIEFIVPGRGVQCAAGGTWELIDPDTGTLSSWVSAGHRCLLYTAHDIPFGTIVRCAAGGTTSGRIRNGRRDTAV